MEGLWNRDTRRVNGESCIFAGSDEAGMLFPAEKILRVFQPSEGKEYLPEKDFAFTPGENVIRRTAGSSMPFLSPEELYPSQETAILFPAKGGNAIAGGPNGKLLRFDGVDFFARSQFEVDYIAAAVDFPVVPDLQKDRLPRFRRKLAEKQPVRVILIGDSISAGYNATKFLNVPPYLPPWIEQFSSGLEKEYGAPVEFRNHAVSGSGCRAAWEIADRWLEAETDLLIAAYGMNDFSRLSPEQYVENLGRIVCEKRTRHPETEFLLVSSMSGNPEWTNTPSGKDVLFADALKQYVASAEKTVALADVFPVWREVIRRKGFYSMTGNGVNHPNDFGHRIYAAVLSELF